MGGSEGIRGYLVQALVVLLDALEDGGWDSVTLEPRADSEAVDVLWRIGGRRRAQQIKSSTNQIGKADAEAWAGALEKAIEANEYELLLVGPCSQGVVDLEHVGRVSVPPPRSLDVDGLHQQAAHKIGKFLERDGVRPLTATTREMLVSAVLTELDLFSIRREEVGREQLRALLQEWTRLIVRDETRTTEDVAGWTRVTFALQSDLRSALRGDSLGYQHVDACPAVPEVEGVVDRLKSSGTAVVVGESGSGKSMAAWHAAHRLHREGWEVHLLTNVAAAGNEPSSATRPVLLVIDDVQAMRNLPVSPATVSPGRALLLISTEPVAGFRGVTRIAGKRSVTTIAEYLRRREQDLLPLLQEFDPRLGERPGDLSATHRIDDARRKSELPWQFMYNLTSRDRSLPGRLMAIGEEPVLHAAIFAIACYQLASRDAPCSPSWLREVLQRHAGIEADRYGEVIDFIDQHVQLLRTVRGVALPHARTAAMVVGAMFDGEDEKARLRRRIFWETVLDGSFPLGGISWLLEGRGFDRRRRDVPGEIVAELVARCYRSQDGGGAGAVLSHLLSTRDSQALGIEENRETVVGWLECASAVDGHGLARLVNHLINVNESVARSLAEAVAPQRIADRLNRLTVSDAFPVIDLIDRMATAASTTWREEVGKALDPVALQRLVAECTHREVAECSVIARTVAMFDESLALRLVAAMSEAISAAIRADGVDGFYDAEEVLWWVLRFAPGFLRGGRQPDEERTMLAARILGGVGSERIAEIITTARPRDWSILLHLAQMAREAAPALARDVARAVDIGRVLERLGDVTRWSVDSLDQFLVCIALDEDNEPASTVIANIGSALASLSGKAAYLSPRTAARMINSGRGVSLQLGGGLPQWTLGAAILGRVHDFDPAAARAILRQNLHALSDSYLFRQSNGGEFALEFLDVARQIDGDAIVEAMRATDPPLAERFWVERAHGGAKERATLRCLLELADEAGGAIADVSARVRALGEDLGHTF
jgi:hypothetical protein